jgi:aspartyl-tRNA synthetase
MTFCALLPLGTTTFPATYDYHFHMARAKIAMTIDEPFIRETQAFPKNQAGVDPMSGAPTDVADDQLRELGLALRPRPLSAD